MKAIRLKPFLPYFYILSVAISIRTGFSFAETKHLLFVLKPLQFLVSLLTNVHFQWVEGLGYLSKDSHILIDKSCSGVNFIIILYCVLYHTVSSSIPRTRPLLWVVICLGFALVFGILGNTMRICILMFLGKNWDTNLPVAHEMIGSSVYLIWIMLLYFSVLKFTQQNPTYHVKIS